MTTQEAIDILTEMRDLNDYINQSDALQMAIDALEKASNRCEDAISRQAVLDGLEKYHENTELQHIDGLTYAYDLVCKLPSVSTEKTGRWRHYEGMLICSKCGAEFYDDIMEYCGDDVPKCCPDCGTKMVEPQESEVQDADSD